MMRPTANRLAAAVALLLTGCVQPAYDRTVIYELDVSQLDSVRTAGVRGDDAPLSWQKDQPMTVVVPVIVSHHRDLPHRVSQD